MATPPDLDVPEPLKTSVAGLHAAVWPPKIAGSANWMIGVHNLTANLHYWGPVTNASAGDVGFAAFDLRGRSGSWGLADSSGMRTHVGDVLAVADALGARRFTVVGHRYGAAVAKAVVQAAPERVTECVMLEDLTSDETAEHRADVARLLDPTVDRLALTFPNRDAYLGYWRSQTWFTAAGVDRMVRRALMTDLAGSGFAWQVRVSRSAIDHDVAELATTDGGVAASQLNATNTNVMHRYHVANLASTRPATNYPLPRDWRA